MLTDDFIDGSDAYQIQNPVIQADNLILWRGGLPEADPGEKIEIKFDKLASEIGGVLDIESMLRVAENCCDKNWISKNFEPQFIGSPCLYISLTYDGWMRYEELLRGKQESRVAFMAMPFKDCDTERAYESCFKLAAKNAGFDLRTTRDGQAAGLIDDYIRVSIRASRFVVADISTSNRGAYWEAGFGEGLGKPVIYTCNKSAWDSKDESKRPHFGNCSPGVTITSKRPQSPAPYDFAGRMPEFI